MKADTSNNRLKHLAFLAFALIIGYCLGQSIDIYNYFYDAKKLEGYFLLISFLVVYTIRLTLSASVKIYAAYYLVGWLVFAFLSLFIQRIIYFISGFNDWGGLICLLASIGLALTIPRAEKRFKPLVTQVIVLGLGLLIGFYSSHNIVGILLVVAFMALTVQYFYSLLSKKLVLSYTGIFLILAVISFFLFPNDQRFNSQNTYFDKIILSQKTRLHQVDVTEWKGHQWIYYNKVKYLSSVDEWMYYEPLVHPLMHLIKHAQRVLVIGGENGCAVRELTKYEKVEIDQLPFDFELLSLAKNNEVFRSINNNIYNEAEPNLIRADIFNYLSKNESTYDAIIIDLPDPTDIEINQFYTQEFYLLCQKAIKPNGMISTQAGSPYFAAKAFLSIQKTLKSVGMNTTLMHNQIPSLGEWGWILAYNPQMEEHISKNKKGLNFNNVETIWLNNEALNILFSFGKINISEESIKINTLKDPVVHTLYKEEGLKIE